MDAREQLSNPRSKNAMRGDDFKVSSLPKTLRSQRPKSASITVSRPATPPADVAASAATKSCGAAVCAGLSRGRAHSQSVPSLPASRGRAHSQSVPSLPVLPAQDLVRCSPGSSRKNRPQRGVLSLEDSQAMRLRTPSLGHVSDLQDASAVLSTLRSLRGSQRAASLSAFSRSEHVQSSERPRLRTPQTLADPADSIQSKSQTLLCPIAAPRRRSSSLSSHGSLSQCSQASHCSSRFLVPRCAVSQSPSPRSDTVYEAVCQESGLLPKFKAVAHDMFTTDGMELNLSGLGLGDLQFSALLRDDVIVPASEVLQWSLRDVRLSESGVVSLVKVMSRETVRLDLGQNRVGAHGAAMLAQSMREKQLPNLRFFDISSNGIGNDAIAALAPAMSCGCPLLLRLEMNHNAISDGSALGALVAELPQLMRLGVHHNNLSGLGVAALFQGIFANFQASGQLADVDVAWNGMIKSGALAGAEAVAAVLRESTALYHLDLSYNGLDAECCRVIGNSLRCNHYLHGLHIVGNAAQLDVNGFLIPLDSWEMASVIRLGDSSMLDLDGRLDSSDDGKLESHTQPCVPERDAAATSRVVARKKRCGAWTCSALLRERDMLEQRSTCWACEGWCRVELEWPISPDEPCPLAVWAFTSIDGFSRGLRLRREPGASKFSTARMVPMGSRLLAVFQVDSSLRLHPEATCEPLLEHVDIELQACKELPELHPSPSDDLILHQTHQVSGRTMEHQFVLRTDRASVVKVELEQPVAAEFLAGRPIVLLDPIGGAGPPVQMPRMTEDEFRMRTLCPEAPSIIASFRRDSDEAMRNCLRVDWPRVRLTRLVPEDQRDEVYEMLQANYRRIVEWYRRLSSIGVSAESGFGVGPMEASDAMTAAGIIDGGATKKSDVDRLFIAANFSAGEEQQVRLAVRPERGLVRHQFLELLMRIAQQRYVQTGECESMAGAVRRMLDDLAGPCDTYIAEREAILDMLQSADADEVLRRHLHSLQAIFQRFSSGGARTRAGFLPLHSFHALLRAIGSHDVDVFHPRMSALAFRLGMMTQPEECRSARFQEMSFVEFLVSLGSVVYLRSDFECGEMAKCLGLFLSTSLLGGPARESNSLL